MKSVIGLFCLAGVVLAGPRPADDLAAAPVDYIPEYRRDAVPEEILMAEPGNLNLDGILINYVDVEPSQANMNDFMELLQDVTRVLEIKPEVIQIADFPFNPDGFNYGPDQFVNLIPTNEESSDADDSDKVIVVNSNDENPEVDMVQVVNTLPKDDAIAEENNVNNVENVEIVNKPINDADDVIQVASIPIQNFGDEISPADDEIRAVKFVERPNMDGSENYIGVPMAPSELDSLRINVQGNEIKMPLYNQGGQIPFNPLRRHSDPWLR